jgi:hypothetical protein
MAVGDVYRLTLQSVFQGQTYLNTWAFTMRSSPDPVASDVLTLANAFKNAFLTRQSNLLTFQTWTFRQLFGGSVVPIQDECRRDGGLVLAGNVSGTSVGSVSTDALPPQCAMVWTLGTGQAGRRRRGRSYAYGFTESDQAAGVWAAAALSSVTTGLNTLFGLYGPAGTDPQFLLGVWSERTAAGCEYRGTPPSLVNVDTPHPELAFNMATGYQLRPTVYNQRRRTIGVGR